MTSPEPQLLAVLISGALALLALVLAGVASVRLAGLHRRLAELEVQAALNDQYYQGLSAGAVGQGEQLARLEQDVVRLRAGMDELAAADGGTVFSQAIAMARKGCSAREIMEACGLSEIEADLVVLMHRSGRAG
jgi:uncharacterized coiled-coil protein SlyX